MPHEKASHALHSGAAGNRDCRPASLEEALPGGHERPRAVLVESPWGLAIDLRLC